MKTSLALETHRMAVRAMAQRFSTVNPRVFGSVAQGGDHEGSDLALLVDALPHTTLFDLGGLQVALEEALGVPVNVRTPNDLPATFRDEVLHLAKPV